MLHPKLFLHDLSQDLDELQRFVDQFRFIFPTQEYLDISTIAKSLKNKLNSKLINKEDTSCKEAIIQARYQINLIFYQTLSSFRLQSRIFERIGQTEQYICNQKLMMSQQKKMLKTVQQELRIAKKSEARTMAQFMIDMAKETQDLDLDPSTVTKAVEYLIQSSFGQTIVQKINGAPTGALFLSFQNKQIWWVASVFVDKAFRGKGIFSKLFKFAIKLARENGVKYLRLYAQETNEKAKNTYRHMGMKQLNDKFYGYDFTLGEQEIKFDVNQSFKIKQLKQIPALAGMVDICQRNAGYNKGLGCYHNGELVGYCEYFLQFSQWRFGLTAYVSTLFIKDIKRGKSILNEFLFHLKSLDQLPVKALRIIARSDGKHIYKFAPGIEKLHYDIMEIELSPEVPKL